MDAHLGYARYHRQDARNGHRAKTVLTDVEPVEIVVAGPGCPVRAQASGQAGAAAGRGR